MSLSRFWTPVRARPEPDEPVETMAAGEPETGVLSLQQLMESLGPSSSAFDPDSTAYFSASELLLRRSQLDATTPTSDQAASRTAAPQQAPCTVAPTSAESPTPGSRNPPRLSPITKVALVLLLPALAMLLLPRSSRERGEQASVSPATARVSPAAARSTSAVASVPASDARAPELEQTLEKGMTPERAAADHLAAGDFERALRDYTALAGRSPAHAAAVRILQRRLKTEREAGR